MNATVTGYLPTLFTDLREYIAGTSSQGKKLSYLAVIEKYYLVKKWRDPKRLSKTL
jgi:hypothetical protein